MVQDGLEIELRVVLEVFKDELSSRSMIVHQVA